MTPDPADPADMADPLDPADPVDPGMNSEPMKTLGWCSQNRPWEVLGGPIWSHLGYRDPMGTHGGPMAAQGVHRRPIGTHNREPNWMHMDTRTHLG